MTPLDKPLYETIRYAAPLPGGRREEPTDGQDIRVRIPHLKQGQLFGVADQLLGASRIRVMCADGKSRLGRIPGKLKKRMWIREGDLVVVQPWEFQDEKCNILHRYTKTEASYLSRRGVVPKSIDIY